jgi:hypothetical protein
VDDCFGSELGTAETYKRVLHPVVRQGVDGFNAALLTIGCSGTGKSTLLHGRTGGEGCVRLAIKGVFEVRSMHWSPYDPVRVVNADP